MSISYNITTNFLSKDTLPPGDPDKVVKGADFTTEFTNIQSAFTLAAPVSSPTFTGTVTIPTVDINGGAIDNTVIGGVTPASATFTTGTFTGSVDAASFVGPLTGNADTATNVAWDGITDKPADFTPGSHTQAFTTITGVATNAQIPTTMTGKTITGTFNGSLSGNATTVTNGVYTTGNQTIGGTKTFSSTIAGSISGNAATATTATTATNSTQLGGVAAASFFRRSGGLGSYNSIQVVSALPGSPDANTIYFVT